MINKIFIILDETYLFQPTLINRLINKFGKKKFVGAIIIKKIPRKNSINKYFLFNLKYFSISEILIYSLLFLKIFFNKYLNFFFKSKNTISVENVVRNNHIPYKIVNYSLKNENIYKFINIKKPDLIISSCSLYIPSEIYKKKNRLCINRHSGKLPDYSGLLPIFHSFCNNENFLYASVNEVRKKIDSGKILFSLRSKLKTKSLYNAYKISFNLSFNALVGAIKKLKSLKKLNNNVRSNNRKYYKFPSKNKWLKFRNNGFKLIEWKDLTNAE